MNGRYLENILLMSKILLIGMQRLLYVVVLAVVLQARAQVCHEHDIALFYDFIHLSRLGIFIQIYIHHSVTSNIIIAPPHCVPLMI